MFFSYSNEVCLEIFVLDEVEGFVKQWQLIFFFLTCVVNCVWYDNVGGKPKN